MLLLALVKYLALLIALVVHEYSHALSAYLMGDETAKRAGRLTLNPVAHADMVGTVILPLAAILSPGLPIIGWAKPVPFNQYNLIYPKWGSTIVALAGPAANFLSALIFLVGLKVAMGPLALTPDNLLVVFLINLVTINVVLGVFNFIPVPPLDGSKLADALLQHPKYARTRFLLETRGPSILLFLILIDLILPISILGTVFGAAVDLFFRLGGF